MACALPGALFAPTSYRVSAMSKTAARPRLNRSACAWEAAKIAVGCVAFAALLLPVAFPSKAGTQVPPAQVASIDTLSASTTTKPLRPKTESTSSTKDTTAVLPAKKPAPNNT